MVVTSADVSVTQTDAPDPVIAGTNLTYTVNITNNGPSDAQAISLQDVLPAHMPLVSATSSDGAIFTGGVGNSATVTFRRSTLRAGASAALTIVVHVDPLTPSGATLANQASVTAATSDPNPGNNLATGLTSVVAMADLRVTMTDAPDPVIAGTNLTYTVALSSAGPSAAQSLSVSDTLPVGTAFISAAAPAGWTTTSPAPGTTGTITFATPIGAVATFTIVVKVNPDVLARSMISNTVSASSAATDPDSSNNTATTTTTVSTSADLVATKVGTPDPVAAGTNITYTITVTNDGPSDSQAYNLTDAIPAGTTTVSFNRISGPAVGSTLPAGGSASFLLVARVNPSVAQGRSWSIP